MNGIFLNGNRVPWFVIVLIGSIVANAAITFYRVDQIEDTIADHETRMRAIEYNKTQGE